MSENIELATDLQTAVLAVTIERVAGAVRGQGEALEVCLECGGKIPEKRRAAMPGCTLCVKCQSRTDKGCAFCP